MKRLTITGILVFLLMFTASFLFISNEGNAQGKTYKIGEAGPSGGWIFYDKGNSTGGWRYLEAAPVDQTDSADWGCPEKSIPGALGTAIGKGKDNTQAIVANCSTANTAAWLAGQYRGGGKSDWFLPSKDELNAMYKNLYKAGIGGFNRFTYWSSSEIKGKAVGAWAQLFGNGSQFESHKVNIPYSVRAIRAF